MIRVVLDYDPQRREIVTIHIFLAHEQKAAESCQAMLTRDHPKRRISLIDCFSLGDAKRKHAQLVGGEGPR